MPGACQPSSFETSIFIIVIILVRKLVEHVNVICRRPLNMLTKSKFRPAWWLRNPHLQTLWAAKVHPAPTPAIKHERLTTPDDDFVDLCWSSQAGGPLVIIFHGLAGSFDSRYVRSLMSTLSDRGTGSVLMHFRGCSGEPNKTAGAYHSGHTADIKLVIDTARQRFPGRPLIAVGYSLGGNALLKYLATQKDNPLQQAVAVCPPLFLSQGARRINRGFSRLYQYVLIRQLKKAMRRKQARYPHLELNRFNYELCNNFIDWDHHITAPLHGFDSGEDYYQRASTLSDLATIETSTHVIFSKDDPFFTHACMPKDNSDLSAQVTFEIVEGAGHVGFITGNVPGFGEDWLRHRLASVISSASPFSL